MVMKADALRTEVCVCVCVCFRGWGKKARDSEKENRVEPCLKQKPLNS